MTVKLTEADKAFIKQGHKRFAEPNTVCRCGGLLKSIAYFCDPWGSTNLMKVNGEKERRGLMVCEDFGALYAI